MSGVGATVYDWHRQRQATDQTVKQRGRQPRINDTEMGAVMKEVLGRTTPASLHGEGFRKVCGRLWQRGLHRDKERIRWFLRTHGLLALMRIGNPRGPRVHKSTYDPGGPRPRRCGSSSMARS